MPPGCKRMPSPSRRRAPAMRRVAGLAATALLGGILLATSAAATPRYAAHYEQRCSLCHRDPSGGGMRTLYAAQFLVPTEMAARTGALEGLAEEGPQVTEALAIGFDLRTVHTYSERDAESTNFFQMQGDLYLAFQLSERFSAYLDRGSSGSTELYGLGYLLPANGYVKVGRFQPTYGWRYADHTLFVRDRQGLAPPGHTDVGIEAGLFPGSFSIQAAALNGALGSPRDRDRDLAGTLRIEFRRSVAGLALAVGGSGLHNPREGDEFTLAGPFGSVRLGPLAWVAEAGWLVREAGAGAGAGADTGAGAAQDLTRFTTSHQLACRLQQGWAVLLTYDFTDPDVDIQDGATTRYGVGSELLLYPFLHLRAAVHYTEDEGPSPLGDEEHYDTELQVHLLY